LISDLTGSLHIYLKNDMGMVIESIRQTEEYKKDKNEFQEAFSRLQRINKIITKDFNKEYKAYREAEKALRNK
jgi:hypothetical protein